MPLSLRQVEGLLFERGDRRLHAILYDYSGGFSWYPFGPDDRLQHDIAGTLGNRARGYIVGTYDKDAGANNQRLYLNGARVAQMSDIQPLDLNSNPLGIGRHVSGIADPFNGHIDEFRIAHDQFRECGYRQHQGCWSSVGQKRFQSPFPRSVAKVNSK